MLTPSTELQRETVAMSSTIANGETGITYMRTSLSVENEFNEYFDDFMLEMIGKVRL